MPLEERQLRMFQLKKRERRMDVDAWVKSFLVEMDSIHGVPSKYNTNCIKQVYTWTQSYQQKTQKI
jgi:trehalose-6-phosphate synthase